HRYSNAIARSSHHHVPLVVIASFSLPLRFKLFVELRCLLFFFFSSRRRHTRSVSAFLLNRSSDLLQILEAFLWFVLITLLNVTLIILTLSVSRLLNLLLRLVAFLLFLNPQCLASISRWITASSSWKRFCLFVCRALSSIMV